MSYSVSEQSPSHPSCDSTVLPKNLTVAVAMETTASLGHGPRVPVSLVDI